ncbi:MAG: hypothetical protein FJ397_02780 [Verrucomicrobia bacterium]|nr:hypothetical protein [Verrucomicrobiota bacterium]
MRTGHWGVVAAGWLALAVARAAGLADLGEGLAYLRLKALPADLTSAPRTGPLVADLRFLPATAEQAAAFGAWLGFQARPGVPLLLVANRETGEELRRVLAGPRPPAVVLIGVPGPGFTPDLEVTAAPEADRQAYAALDAGSTLAGLLADHPGKARQDELSLRLGGETSRPPAPGAGPAPAEPVVDAALQRAVHLHRAHRALRRG